MRLNNTVFQPYTPPQNKFRNISFGAEDAMERNTPTPTTQPRGLEDIYSEVLNRPDGPATTSYRNFLAEGQPNREDFKPTKMNRLAAILSGVAAGASGDNGFNAARNVIDRPYLEALAMRNNKLGDLKSAADLEEGSIKNRMSNFKDITGIVNQGRTADRQDKLAEGQLGNYQSQIAKRDFDMKNSGWTPTTDINGNRIYTRMGANGPEIQETGLKTAQSPQEKLRDSFSLANHNSALTTGRQNSYFDRTNPILSGQQDSRQRQGFINQAVLQGNSQKFSRDQANSSGTRQINQNYAAYQAIIRDSPIQAKHFDENGMPIDGVGANLLQNQVGDMYGSGVPGLQAGDDDFVLTPVDR